MTLFPATYLATIFLSSLKYIMRKTEKEKEPNSKTYSAMEDAENERNMFGPFDSIEEMMQALEQDDEETK